MDQEILLRVKFRERLEFIKFIHAELKFEQFLQKGNVIDREYFYSVLKRKIFY